MYIHREDKSDLLCLCSFSSRYVYLSATLECNLPKEMLFITDRIAKVAYLRFGRAGGVEVSRVCGIHNCTITTYVHCMNG